MTKSSKFSDLGNLKASNAGTEVNLGVPGTKIEFSEVSSTIGQYVDFDENVELGGIE